MKSEIRSITPTKVELTYPCLMQSFELELLIVLAYGPRSGVVIATDTLGSPNPVGYVSNCWPPFDDPAEWELLPANQSVVLSNN